MDVRVGVFLDLLKAWLRKIWARGRMEEGQTLPPVHEDFVVVASSTSRSSDVNWGW